MSETNGNSGHESSCVDDTDDSPAVGGSTSENHQTLVRDFHDVVEPEQILVNTVQGNLDLNLVMEGIESADAEQVRAIQNTERVMLTSGIAEYYCRRWRLCCYTTGSRSDSLQCQWSQSDGSRAEYTVES